MLTFCSFVGMNKGSPFKTISAMTLGFALATVGMDTVTGQLRLTFGNPELMRGFDFLIAVIGLFVILTCVPLFASILRIPFSIIAPVIIAICAVGAYTVHNAMFDVWLMLGFGVVGYIFKKLDYLIAPMVLALVLGDPAEDSFRQSMLFSQGSLDIFFSNPLVGGITSLALLLLFWPLIGKFVGKKKVSAA